MNLLISMPGGMEWMVIFGLFSGVVPIVLVILVIYFLYRQTKLLQEIRDEMRRNNISKGL